MKSRLFSIYFSLFCVAAHAQLICPDFLMADMNNQPWHLYDVLDQGKIVYIFKFDPLSESAWAYHNSGEMNTFYDTHGPLNADAAMVFGMTGSDAWAVTNYDSEASLGNWQTDMPYPIFCRDFEEVLAGNPDTTSQFTGALKFLFNLNWSQSLFSVFRICPDRTITRYAIAPTAELMAADMSLCTVATQTRDAKIGTNSFDTKPNCPQEVRPISVTITNLGTEPLTSCNIRRIYEGHAGGNFAWTGNLPTYQSEVVQLPDVLLYGDSARLHFRVEDPNGQTDLNHDNDTIHYYLKPSAHWVAEDIRVEIQTDGYGPSLYWDITGSDGLKIDSGGNHYVYLLDGNGAPDGYGYPDNYHFEKTIPLTGDGLDCATIRVLSGLGYGICCDYGDGYVRFKQGDEVIFEYTNFGRRAYDKFDVTWVGTDDTPTARAVTLYPNPTDGNITVAFHLDDMTSLDMSVYNIMGQRVLSVQIATYPSGKQEVGLQTQTLPNGIYWLTLRDAARVQAVKFVVAR